MTDCNIFATVYIFVFSDPKPVVECSFITEFEDHTLVAMDAEVILFLHDLIASYIREKDKGRFYYTPRKLCLWWVYCFHIVRPSVCA